MQRDSSSIIYILRPALNLTTKAVNLAFEFVEKIRSLIILIRAFASTSYTWASIAILITALYIKVLLFEIKGLNATNRY